MTDDTDVAAPFDVALLLDELETAEMTVINPKTGEPVVGSDGKPWQIVFAGPKHKSTREWESRDRVATMRASRQRGLKGAEERLERAEEIDADQLCARCLGWSPVMMGGADFPCTEANKRKVFGTQHMRSQAFRFLGDAASFLPNSPTS